MKTPEDDIKYYQVLITKDGLRSEMTPILPSEYRPRIHRAMKNHKQAYTYTNEDGNLDSFTTINERTYKERSRVRAIIVELWEE